MASRSKKSVLCRVCTTNPSKYTCSKCLAVYCSVPCYKQHQQGACLTLPPGLPAPTEISPEYADSGSNPKGVSSLELEVQQPKSLRPLTSLRWPYVPEASAYPDPLKRDDPKDLQLRQYEAIATSPKIREILSKHENLPSVLTLIDNLRGAEREQTLQKALGVTAPDIDHQRKPEELNEDMLVLRELAEAVEAAIRGGNESALGLNWGE